jgi:REP element-mobilizing transposase RayT
MSRYRRLKLQGGTFFFTVTISDRSNDLLVRHVPPALFRSPSKIAKREMGLWQRRYWEHAIRDEADLARHIDYIHFNPVKHGLVSCARDWPHSSFHSFVERGTLPVDWGGDMSEVKGSFGE